MAATPCGVNRRCHALLAPLLAVLGLLLSLTGNASSAFNQAAQNPHYGEFLLQQSEVSGFESLQLADPTKENGEWVYDGALGVPVYVNQNPWTKFDPEGLFWSAIVTAGFAVYDTYQYASGNISGADYAGRMALNGAALLADAATGGMGGGVAVRTAAIAARAGKVGVAAVKTAVAVDKADMAVSTAQAAISTVDAVQEGDYKRAALSAVQVGLSAKSTRQQSEELADTMRPRDWSPTHSQNQKLTSETEQSHHIVQNAAVENQAGYSRGTAPTTKLEGGSHAPGSPHDIANNVQKHVPQGMRGTYGGERDVAYLAMRAAGQSRGTSKANLSRADRYFEGELGMNRQTKTEIPKKKRN